MTLSTLRTLLETATEADQGEVLEMAFDVFLPRPCEPWNGNQWNDEYSQYHVLRVRFCHMIEAKAYTDAALLIMREVLPGWRCISDEDSCEVCDELGDFYECCTGNARSLAIIAAICAAKGDGDA
jgi:hypothetical protein